ncbi:MAG TPA: flavoprotein [Ktedonobacteraceae bacterium]|nr:flavoprotein [Ktedonobacteraceae bacterium]
MNHLTKSKQAVLYWIACGSSAATRVVEPGVRIAQQRGWDVCVITTPQGRNFLNLPLLAQLTGHPVRSEYKMPDTPDLLPRADALLVYPASFRTINTWATGDSATLAVGLLCEYLGLRVPIVAVPYTGEGLDRHPAFLLHLNQLKEWGVQVIYDREAYPPMNNVPCEIALGTLHQLWQQRGEGSGTP